MIKLALELFVVSSMQIAVIDHGFANLGSLTNILICLGYNPQVISSHSEFTHQKKFSGFILPGVGAFGPAMKSLRSKKLDIVIDKLVQQQCRGMGICLGMQMLSSGSEEDDYDEPGLGYFSGYVRKLPAVNANVPHIAWSETFASTKNSDLRKLLAGAFYYIHSYAYEALDNSSEVVAKFSHGNINATAAIHSGHLLGVQFHPEKSQGLGLALLKDYFTTNL